MQVVVENVSKTFTHKGNPLEVLQGVNLTVEQGEFVCLLGPSGCGKSTIIHLIAGLVKPTTGRILVDGKPNTGPHASRTVVFQ